MFAMEELLLRLGLSMLLGSIIGIEREAMRKSAGLRTHALVCLGACIFTMASISLPEVLAEGAQADYSRIAAGIVTGIGFLGAGAIFRAKDHVEGLTTAADLWVVAAIGLLVGLGYYTESIVAALLVFGVLLSGTVLKMGWKRYKQRKVRQAVGEEKV